MDNEYQDIKSAYDTGAKAYSEYWPNSHQFIQVDQEDKSYLEMLEFLHTANGIQKGFQSMKVNKSIESKLFFKDFFQKNKVKK